MNPPNSTSVINLILLLTIFLCGLSINLVSSQTDSCFSNLNLSGLPFDTSSLHCVSAWPSQGYVLRYEQSATKLWSFVLSTPDENSYVAMGFSSNGRMVGSSAIVGWISGSDGSSMIKQYHLEGQSPSQVIPDKGNLNINSSMIMSQSSRIYLAFQLITDQPLSHPIYAIGRTGFVPSAPSYTLTQHQEAISTTLNYVTGQSSEASQHTRLRRGHGMLGMLGWGILMIIGAISARYLKEWDPLWFYAHTILQSLGFLLGIIGVIIGFVLEDRVSKDVSTHKTLGILILVLGCLQVMAFLARPEKSSKVRKYWNWYHYGVGRTLMALAIANVFYGLQLADEDNGWNVGYGIVIALLFITSVVLEIRLWKRN